MRNKFFFLPACFCLCLFANAQQAALTLNTKDDGYRGIWYANQPSNDEYVYKYGGGLATYPANHYPFSVYVAKVKKTFFCYGGTDSTGKTLLHAVSYFDHTTGMVPRPTIVLDKKTNDAHDNPVLNIDAAGYIWIFSTAHGTSGPSYIHKSVKPYDVSEFKAVKATKIEHDKTVPLNNFSYLQTWYQPGRGFINLLTHYDRHVIPGQPSKPRRTISYMTSSDGVAYSSWTDLAVIEEGHYQTSGQFKNTVATVFNFHPVKNGENGLNYRSNLYYMQSNNFGKSWQSAAGKQLTLPLSTVENDALVKDYFSEGLNVYINDVGFDKKGRPVILYITGKGYEAGPEKGPRQWHTAYYNGKEWEIREVTQSDNNYDMGSLYIKGNAWQIIGPTADGPQQYNTGGEIVLWTSSNKGRTWTSKQLTHNSAFNHSYPRRPVSAHKDFYAFWADGNGRAPSASRLYFCDSKGNVYQLPYKMETEFAHPVKIKP
jgi:hypothetical protein